MDKLDVKKIDIRVYFILALTYLIIFSLLTVAYYNTNSSWREGEKVSEDIIVPRIYQFSKKTTESHVGIGKDIYKINTKDFEKFLNTLDQFFSGYENKVTSNIIDKKQFPEIDSYLSSLPPSKIKNMKLIIDELLIEAFNNAKDTNDISEILASFYNNLRVVNNLTEEEKKIIRKIVNILSKKFYQQKDVLLKEKTTQKIKESSLISPGQTLIKEGEEITEEKRKTLKYFNIKKRQIFFINYFSLFVLSFLIYFLFSLYLLFFKKEFLKNKRKFYLLLFFLMFSILLGIFILPTYYYIFPITFFSIIITIAISDIDIGIFYILTLILLLSLINSSHFFNFFIFLLLSGIMAIFLMKNPKDRSVFTRTGIIIGVLNFFLIFFLDIYKFQFNISTIRSAFFAFSSGFLSALLSLGILPIIENIFAISTSIKLLELSDPNQPLLRRLLEEAPGTYQHSAIVSNLGVVAASTIGANPLLVRAGGFYHDIGKLKRPYFFIENQISDKNIHNEIQPTLSTLAIISHVKDGVELAKKYNIPEEIINIIREHHGTSLVSYFYSRAITESAEKKDKVEEEVFRYLGPKPQSKESAIIMLADAVEAASRTLVNPTPTKIKNFIHSIFERIIKDGQLDDSPLTFRDLTMIEETFEKFLLSMFHSRIEYPKIKPAKE